MDMNIVGLKSLTHWQVWNVCVCVFMLKTNNLHTLPSINPVSPTSFYISLMTFFSLLGESQGLLEDSYKNDLR